jgi:RNA polymerase sigma-70 factor (ECF subfamily)
MHADEKHRRRRPDDAIEVAALLRSAQSGDRDAYGALYLRFGPVVNAVLLSHAQSDDVPDLLQDVFLHAWSRLDTVRDPAAFGGWLAQVARNVARMKHRSSLTLVPLDDQMPASREPDAGAIIDGDRALAAIRSLPETYREPLLLRLVEGMSGAEIAARTGLTEGSVRVTLHRGMAILRQKLGGTP